MFNYEFNSGTTARPVFMSVDLESPLGFTAFLANVSNHRKVFIPATFNMSKVLKSVQYQESTNLVCDSAFYDISLPGPMEAEYKGGVTSVTAAVVGGSNPSIKSSIFSAKVKVIDPYTLE